jgi:hypothetical protein
MEEFWSRHVHPRLWPLTAGSYYLRIEKRSRHVGTLEFTQVRIAASQSGIKLHSILQHTAQKKANTHNVSLPAAMHLRFTRRSLRLL